MMEDKSRLGKVWRSKHLSSGISLLGIFKYANDAMF